MAVKTEIHAQTKVLSGLKNDIMHRRKANCLLELKEREIRRNAIRLQNEMEDLTGTIQKRESTQRKDETEIVGKRGVFEKMQEEKKKLSQTLDRLRAEKSTLSVFMTTTQERLHQEQESSDRIIVGLRDQQIKLDSSLADLRSNVTAEEQKLIQLSNEISHRGISVKDIPQNDTTFLYATLKLSITR
jgi:chromosome segregation ATPase